MRRLLILALLLSAAGAFAQDAPGAFIGLRRSGSGSVAPSVMPRWYDVRYYGTKGDVRSVADASIGAGSSTLTSATAAFTSADTGKLVTVAMGAQFVSSLTYASGLAVTGSAGDTCTFSAFDGGGAGATATIYLTSTNTIAASTPLLITNQGTGYTAAPTTATVASGTATCAGTPVLVGAIRPAAIQSTASFSNATTITIGTAATTAVSGGHMTIGTDDTAAIQAAVTAAQAASSTVYIPSGTYQITSPITVSHGVTIEGDGIYPYYGTRTGHALNSVMPQEPPYMTGSVLLMTKPNTDGMLITVAGEAVHLRGIGIRFDDTFAFLQTGHGIDAIPPIDGLGEMPDLGVFGGTWNNLGVFGHDGNHYAWELVNIQYMTISSLQSWGGGGMDLYAHANWVNPGNNVLIHPYAFVWVGGTTHGYHVHLTTTSSDDGMVLNYFARPQAITQPMPPSEVARGASALNSKQCVFFSDEHSHLMTLDSPDFEPNAGCDGAYIAGTKNGFTDNMYQAGGTQGVFHSRFLHASNGTLEIMGNASTTVPVTTISQFANTIAGPSTDFTSGIVTNQAVNFLSPPGGNVTVRLGDFATAPTRKEFVFRLDLNGMADIDTIWQGNATWPLRLQVSGGPLILTGYAITPASSGAVCTTGTIRWDADYIYICTSTNAWKRAGLTSW